MLTCQNVYCYSFLRVQYSTYCISLLQLPTGGDLWSYYMDMELRRMDSWEKIVPSFRYDKEVPFFDMLVPTVDTVRFGYILDKLLSVQRSVLYTGGTGVGKVWLVAWHISCTCSFSQPVSIFLLSYKLSFSQFLVVATEYSSSDLHFILFWHWRESHTLYLHCTFLFFSYWLDLLIMCIFFMWLL